MSLLLVDKWFDISTLNAMCDNIYKHQKHFNQTHYQKWMLYQGL